MQLKIYQIFSNLFSPIIFVFFIFRFLKSKENKNSILYKFCLKKEKRPPGKLIWINSVSIGESKSALIVAEKICHKNPKAKILFTTSTLSSFNLIPKKKKNLIFVYSPIDIGFVIKRFLNMWKPDLAIFMESEIWPNTINFLNKEKVKFIILNGRMSNKSYNFWHKLKFFSKKIFGLIDLCIAQERSSAMRYKNLGTKRVELMGNLKFLSKKLQVNEKYFLNIKKKLKSKKIITLFSSHFNEEKLLIECAKNLQQKYKNLFFILIPRHINRVESIKKLFFDYKIEIAIRSKNNNFLNRKKFLLVDTFGELGTFFKFTDIAIVGGSFASKGGHNPIETYHFNCALVFGPHMYNFEDITSKIIKTNGGFIAKDANDLEKKISFLLNNPKKLNSTIINFKKFCNEESKKANSIFQKLKPFID